MCTYSRCRDKKGKGLGDFLEAKRGLTRCVRQAEGGFAGAWARLSRFSPILRQEHPPQRHGDTEKFDCRGQKSDCRSETLLTAETPRTPRTSLRQARFANCRASQNPEARMQGLRRLRGGESSESAKSFDYARQPTQAKTRLEWGTRRTSGARLIA